MRNRPAGNAYARSTPSLGRLKGSALSHLAGVKKFRHFQPEPEQEASGAGAGDKLPFRITMRRSATETKNPVQSRPPCLSAATSSLVCWQGHPAARFQDF